MKINRVWNVSRETFSDDTNRKIKCFIKKIQECFSVPAATCWVQRIFLFARLQSAVHKHAYQYSSGTLCSWDYYSSSRDCTHDENEFHFARVSHEQNDKYYAMKNKSSAFSMFHVKHRVFLLSISISSIFFLFYVCFTWNRRFYSLNVSRETFFIKYYI